MRSADTSPKAHAIQTESYRAMTSARRVSIAVDMSEEATTIAAAGIGARHPDYDESQVSGALRRIRGALEDATIPHTHRRYQVSSRREPAT